MLLDLRSLEESNGDVIGVINGSTNRDTGLISASEQIIGVINGATSRDTGLISASEQIIGVINGTTTRDTGLISASEQIIGVINGTTARDTGLISGYTQSFAAGNTGGEDQYIKHKYIIDINDYEPLQEIVFNENIIDFNKYKEKINRQLEIENRLPKLKVAEIDNTKNSSLYAKIGLVSIFAILIYLGKK